MNVKINPYKNYNDKHDDKWSKELSGHIYIYIMKTLEFA